MYVHTKLYTMTSKKFFLPFYSVITGSLFILLLLTSCVKPVPVTLIWHFGTKNNDSIRVETVKLPMSGIVTIDKDSVPSDAWALDVIPEFMTAEKGDEGWWMDGRGDYGNFTRDEGHNSWWRSHTPLFAVSKAGKTMAAHMLSYRFDYDLCVDVKAGHYSVFPRIRFDKVREFFPLYNDVRIKYFPVDGYVGLAKYYRKYQFDHGVKPIRERVKDYPALGYLSNAMVIRLQTHGAKPIPPVPTDFTPETELPIDVHLTFDDATHYIEALHEAGVQEAAFVSAGWNYRGYDGAIPEHFPVEEAFGGESRMRNMISRAKELGYMMMLHGTYTEVYSICPRFDESLICKRADGSRVVNGVYFGGTAYWSCAKKLYEDMPREMRLMKDLGVEGNHYLDVFSATYPSCCADPRHPATHEEMAEYQNRIMLEAKNVFGGACSEGGFDHVAANTDCINYVSYTMKKLHDGKTEGLELVDGVKPLWELIYHGTILYTSDRLTQNHTRGQNHAKRDESGNLDWLKGDGIVDPAITLKIAEFGGRPIFYTYLEEDIPAIKLAYDQFQPLKHLQTALMEDHYEFAPGVFVTEYDNGEKVVCNYNDTAFIYKGISIESKNYGIIK